MLSGGALVNFGLNFGETGETVHIHPIPHKYRCCRIRSDAASAGMSTRSAVFTCSLGQGVGPAHVVTASVTATGPVLPHEVERTLEAPLAIGVLCAACLWNVSSVGLIRGLSGQVELVRHALAIRQVRQC